ncbi:hypothetical protein [Micromonospora sp. CPCC 206061]|uniref:hypothetical protein n=1 Tax=Micromonospora sp. CPCC 206061 TaxID=3122410 RepID=UPI002FF31160
MGTYLKIDGDPNEIGGTGAILRSMAESFSTEARAVVGDITTIEGEQPWGGDSYGNGFRETYNKVPDGADKPLRAIVQDNMSAAGERLTKVGDNTVLAMAEYQGTDDDSGQKIRQTNI